jgi:4-amino-4-deoxy-L-arabinose transferase-like glycosyltransferase
LNFILSLLALLAVGMAVLIISLRQYISRLALPEFLSFSFFTGIGVISCQLFLYFLLGIRFTFWNIIYLPGACFIFIVLYFIFKKKPSNWDFKALVPLSFSEKLILAGLLLQVLYVFYITLPRPVDSYDALWNYALKARIFYFSQGIPEGFFSWGGATVGNVDYPLMLPFLMTWVYIFIGFNDLIVTNVMPVIYVFFLVLLYFLLRRFFDRKYALFGVFVLATIQQIANYAAIMYAELLLLVFVTTAFLYFMHYINSNDRAYIMLASCSFGFSLLVKIEAIVFVFAFLFCMALLLIKKNLSGKKHILRDLAVSIVIISVIAGPWLVFKHYRGLTSVAIDIAGLTPERLISNIKETPILLYELQKQVFGPKKWNIFWMAVILILIFKNKKLFKGSCFYISAFLIFSLAGYLIAYMTVTGVTFYFCVTKTISRFMIHFAGVFMFLAMYLLKDDKEAGQSI